MVSTRAMAAALSGDSSSLSSEDVKELRAMAAERRTVRQQEREKWRLWEERQRQWREERRNNPLGTLFEDLVLKSELGGLTLLFIIGIVIAPFVLLAKGEYLCLFKLFAACLYVATPFLLDSEKVPKHIGFLGMHVGFWGTVVWMLIPIVWLLVLLYQTNFNPPTTH